MLTELPAATAELPAATADAFRPGGRCRCGWGEPSTYGTTGDTRLSWHGLPGPTMFGEHPPARQRQRSPVQPTPIDTHRRPPDPRSENTTAQSSPPQRRQCAARRDATGSLSVASERRPTPLESEVASAGAGRGTLGYSLDVVEERVHVRRRGPVPAGDVLDDRVFKFLRILI